MGALKVAYGSERGIFLYIVKSYDKNTIYSSGNGAYYMAWNDIKKEAGNFLKREGAKILDGLFSKTGVVTLSCSGETLTFPVTPSEFGVSVSNNNGTVNIIGAGDYNMIGKTGLKQITISSFFPAQNYNFSVGDTSAYELVEMIEAWRTGTEPLNISVEDSPINFDCLIESFSYKEQDGSGDVYFDLQLKEYRRVIDTVTDEETGLKERPSTLEQIGKDTAVQILQGKPPLKAIKEAGRKALVQVGEGYLNKYKDMIKIGKVKIGDYIRISEKGIKINEKEIRKDAEKEVKKWAHDKLKIKV
jgi:hypothetical protein